MAVTISEDSAYIDYSVGVYDRMDYSDTYIEMSMENIDELIEIIEANVTEFGHRFVITVGIESKAIGDGAVEFLSRLFNETSNEAYYRFYTLFTMTCDITIQCRNPSHFEKFNLKHIKFVCGSRAKSAR
jgi:hypothetical protein